MNNNHKNQKKDIKHGGNLVTNLLLCNECLLFTIIGLLVYTKIGFPENINNLLYIDNNTNNINNIVILFLVLYLISFMFIKLKNIFYYIVIFFMYILVVYAFIK